MTENANDRFERLAAAFKKSTGFMAPGKDDPLAREQDAADRTLLWSTFVDGVRCGEATRAAPREPGEAERLNDILDWFNGDGESLVYRAIEWVAEDGHHNAKHIAQYSCDAIARLLRKQLVSAPRPDAGDGRPDGAATS